MIQRSRRTVVGASALGLGLAAVLVALADGPGERAAVVRLVAAVLVVGATRMIDRWWRSSGERGWRMLSLLGWYWVAGQVVIGTALLCGVAREDFDRIGAFYLPGTLVVAIAGIELAHHEGSSARWHLWAETTLLSSAGALAVWPLIGAPRPDSAGQFLALLVVAGYLVAAAAMMSAWLRRGEPRIAWLAVGLTGATVAQLLDLPWVPGLSTLHFAVSVAIVVLVLATGVAHAAGLRVAVVRVPAGLRLAIVLSPVAVAGVLSTVALVRGARADGVSLALGATMALALLASQAAYHRENRALLRRLRGQMAEVGLAGERTRALLDGLVEAVLVIGPDGRVLEANESFATLTGWTADDVRGADGLSFAAPADRSLVLAGIDGLRGEPAATGTTEMRVLRRDGSELWVDGSARNLIDDPAVGALVITMRDITERREAAQRLAEAQQLFRTAFEAAPIGMVVATPDGRMVEVNGAFARMLGYAPEELEGRRFEGLLALPARGQPAAELLERFAHTGTWTADLVFSDAAGRRVVTASSGRRIDDAAGGPLVICQIQDVTVARHTADQLAWSSTHDALTGLPNRVELLAAATAALGTRGDRAVGVLAIDVDRFKLVNDGLGHAAGDELLQVVSRRLAAVVRSGDVVARLGADEFAVVVTAASEAGVLAADDRIRHAVAEPVLLSDGDLYVTASIGVALAAGDATAEALLRDADAALYRAKDRGRNRVERFDDETRRTVVATLQTSTDLHRALERDELVVHYQPVVDLADGSIRAVEALVRWCHPERGMVSPAEFIPMAEDTGLIVPVGERVLDIAAADLARWQARPGWEGLAVNVNLSPRQMAAPNVVDMFERAIGRHGIDPDGLWVEITESALMADVRMATVILRALRGMGLHVAVDDFGTGYSSLTYLTRFPVECLKIDRSFVAGLGDDTGAAAIVDAVLGLGRTMGLSVVSEGIETEDQAARLRAMGGRFGQGYLYSRPVPAAALDELLDRSQPARRVVRTA